MDSLGKNQLTFVPCWVEVILVIIIVIWCLAIFLFIWNIWLMKQVKKIRRKLYNN